MLELNKRIRKEDREREKLSLLRLSLFIERQQRRKMNLTTVYIPFFSSSPLSCADKKSAAVLLLINFQSVNNY
jgi:poly-D-alanine transfer protein DltD